MAPETTQRKKVIVIRVRTLCYIVAGLLIVGFWQRDKLRDHLLAHLLGSVELAREKYGYGLPTTVNRIELYELFDARQALPEELSPEYYHYREMKYRLGPKRELIGIQESGFADNWRSMGFAGEGGMCHYPAFLVKFFMNDKKYGEGSVCWQCGNFRVPTLFGSTLIGLGTSNNTNATHAVYTKFKEVFPDSTKWKEPGL